MTDVTALLEGRRYDVTQPELDELVRLARIGAKSEADEAAYDRWVSEQEQLAKERDE